ncbi:alpha/beta fold hydrolase, partial [Heyndrickxia ginsengihumi]|uniref:alpha/beta fold hydrolase n=1 Tax=Heyndrickxia ginsengihumi TaxID=363870 RepID=UPI000472F0D3
MLIKVNNNNIHYIKSGNQESNKTILFIHGSAMTGILMERVYNLLPEFNNISLDLPGHNKSEGELLSTPELLADFITDFIKEMKLKGEITDDLTVAGYSLGGCITLELALRRVSDVKRIVVLNSCDFANSELAKIVPDFYEDYDPSNVFSIVFGSKSTPKETSTYFAEHRSSSLASYTDLKAATSYVLKDFNKIYIPTMFIACGQDKLAPIENIKKLHSMIQNSSLSIIPFYGHLGILETPETYAQNIKDFINYNGFPEIDGHKFEHFIHSIPHLSDTLFHEEINKTFQLVIDSLKEDNPAVAEKYAYSVAFSLYDDPNAKDPFWSNSAKSLV